MTIQISNDTAQIIVIATFSLLLVKVVLSSLVTRKPARRKITRKSTSSSNGKET